MLTRVYGTAFFKQAELDEHLERLEQARARDHRRLGRSSGSSSFSDVAAGRGVLAAARARTVFNELVAPQPRDVRRRTATPRSRRRSSTTPSCGRPPVTGSSTATTCSRRESEDRELGLKPMNCPGHAQLFRMQQWSYRDLPVRYSEPGLLHRNELSGTLHGLLRVRHFVQDDAHIFCTPEQALDEAKACLDMAFETYAVFGIEPHARAVHPARRAHRRGRAVGRGRGAARPRAGGQGARRTSCSEGDGAFYGPKIDLHFPTRSGRSWQLGTVQLDFQLPERFDLTYTGADNAEHRVVMLHRALFGSYERFIGILLEDTAGELPLLAGAGAGRSSCRSPTATPSRPRAVRDALRAAGVRAEVDDAHRVGRAQDPRGRAAQDPLHARRRRPRGRGGRGRRAPPRRGRRRAPSRSPSVAAARWPPRSPRGR